jgi:hypothetical protein
MFSVISYLIYYLNKSFSSSGHFRSWIQFSYDLQQCQLIILFRALQSNIFWVFKMKNPGFMRTVEVLLPKKIIKSLNKLRRYCRTVSVMGEVGVVV